MLETRTSQEERLINHLAKYKNKRISARDIVVKLRMLQYSARIRTLRRKGYRIENKIEYKKNKFNELVKYGYFKLNVNPK